MSDPYRAFIRGIFPNAIIVADRFHVQRLLSPAINRHRNAIPGDQQTNPIRHLLLSNRRDLDARSRWLLLDHPTCGRSTRRKSPSSASIASAASSRSTLPELVTFRETLVRWRREVLAVFRGRATSGMLQRQGQARQTPRLRLQELNQSFANCRLRLLYACA